jgi:hypothetical protein
MSCVIGNFGSCLEVLCYRKVCFMFGAHMLVESVLMLGVHVLAESLSYVHS